MTAKLANSDSDAASEASKARAALIQRGSNFGRKKCTAAKEERIDLLASRNRNPGCIYDSLKYIIEQCC